MSEFAKEVTKGDRFEFGKNWQQFLTTLDDKRVEEAEASLKQMLGVTSLDGKQFLDIGSGSGLFSLVARRLGARVTSFDYDPHSVACTKELRKRYFSEDSNWTVQEGSVLDETFLETLGQFDVVYSWGVLHHTGQMWNAIGNAANRVAPGGQFFIAIYNDQGWASKVWLWWKQSYNRLPPSLRFLVIYPCFVRLWLPTTIKDILRGKPFQTWRSYHIRRGMSGWHDVIDWVGGYPFEVASTEKIVEFLRPLGFEPLEVKSCGKGHGCNEFVLRRVER